MCVLHKINWADRIENLIRHIALSKHPLFHLFKVKAHMYFLTSYTEKSMQEIANQSNPEGRHKGWASEVWVVFMPGHGSKKYL